MEDQSRLEAIPQPWKYNPSSWSQRIIICFIAFIAVVIAVYMGLYQWRFINTVWDPIFGSQTKQVLDSDVSHQLRVWLRIPDAILGAFAYLGDIIFALAGSTRRWQDRPWMVMLFGLDVIPLGIVSVILVVLQGTVVGAWCFPCLITALISIILIFLAYDEVWTSILFLRAVWRRSKSVRVVWDTFWGKASEIAYEAGESMIQDRAEKKMRNKK
jgi:hypothetical protein